MYQNHWLNLLLLADVKIDWIIQHADQQVDTAASQPNDHLLCTDASMHGHPINRALATPISQARPPLSQST